MKIEYDAEDIKNVFTDWYSQKDKLIGESVTADDGEWTITAKLTHGGYELKQKETGEVIEVSYETLKKFLD